MTKMRHLLQFLLMAGLFFSHSFAQAQGTAAGQDRYQDCLGLVETDAKKARTEAQDWYIKGGGVAARHCEAMALFSLARFKEAAELFEKLAGELIIGEGVTEYAYERRDLLKAELYTHAALSWQAAGQDDKAYNNFSVALIGASAQMRHDLYLERGLLQMARRENLAAVKDFTEVITLSPEESAGYHRRATAFRHLKSYHRARRDLDRALKISPTAPELLLESGILYRVAGDREAARAQWEKIIKQGTTGEFRKLARQNIDLLKPALK